MEVILSPDKMRAYDRHATTALSLPGTILMENAGAEVARFVRSTYGQLTGRPVVIVVGKGNNGGDGLVIARHLIDSGAEISVVVIGRSSELSGETRVNFKALTALSRSHTNLRIFFGASALSKLNRPAIVIDAIFGTGFSGIARGPQKVAIEWINRSGASIVAVDIPTGLNGLTGLASGVAVKANMTVTMAFRKAGMLLNDGPSLCGEVSIISIGATRFLPKSVKPDLFAVNAAYVASLLPERQRSIHKYSILKTAVISGSRGMTGAPLMTCKAAIRAGGGLVRLCTPISAATIVATTLPESMVTPLAETAEGALSIECLPKLREVLEWADVVLIGPGLSKNPSTQELIRVVLGECVKPIVLDADGLNAVSLSFLKKLKRKSALILTPHVGEAERLSGIASDEIEHSRGTVAAEFAKSSNSVFVLKGAPTVIGTASGTSYINTSGNPNLATPGSGDILTGLIGGLLAQRLEPLDAAIAGVYLHGKAADLLRMKMGDRGLLATDLVNEIPFALNDIRIRSGN